MPFLIVKTKRSVGGSGQQKDVETHVTLPKWLDTFIFNELGAKYCRSNADMTVIDWDKNDMLNYLGTYFPRSYAESSCIFNDFFVQQKPKLLSKDEISIFDFGCGTGGEIVGLIEQLVLYNCTVRKIKVYAFDGNHNALRLCESVIRELNQHIEVTITFVPIPLKVDDLYDMSILDYVLNNKFDIIISFKAICEFVTKERFEETNAYEHVLKTFLPKLNEDGLILLVDVTTYSEVSNEWLPRMMDKAILLQQCYLVHRNKGYNQAIYVSHSHRTDDLSKVAWRMVTIK